MTRARATRPRRRTSLAAGDEGPSERRLAALGLVVVAAVAVVAWLSTVAIDGGPLSDPYLVRVEVPAGGPQLKDGDDVRVAGLRAGTVRRVERGRTGPLLTLALDDGPVGRDATARVRLRGLSGATYVEVEPGGGPPLASGGRLAAGAGTSAVDLADVVGAFDGPTRTGLRRSLRGLGGGLAGRGDDLGAALEDLGPAAGGLTPLARAAVPRPGSLTGLVRDLGGVAGALAGAPTAAAVVETGRAVRALEAAPVGAAVDALPGLEAEAARTLPALDALLAEAAPAARRLRPAARALDRALPDLRGALAARAGLREAAALGRAATPVLRAAGPLLRDLRESAGLLGPLTAQLGPLARHLVPYREELLLAPLGFTRWGNFRYDEGQAKGSRAVRFQMVLTCAPGRDPYPAPGAALEQREACPR